MLLAFVELSFENFLWLILALVVAYLAKQLVTPPPPPRPIVKKAPIVMREYKKEELARYTGADPTTPICIALKGKIYDVTRGRSFYGPGGSYGIFSGHDASYALAKGSLEVADLDKSIDDLTPAEKSTLDDWTNMYEGKYQVVGWLEGFPALSAPASTSS